MTMTTVLEMEAGAAPPPCPPLATTALTGAILVHMPTQGPPEAVEAAVQLARASGAGLIGVAAERLDPFSVESQEYAFGETLEARLDAMRRRLRDAAERFDFITRDVADRTLCCWEETSPEQALVRHAAGADWIVAARPSAGTASRLPDPAELILRSGLPVLLIPPHAQAPLQARRIVVGWRDMRETRRAVSAAMPLLTAAEEVLVAAIAPRRSVADARASLAQVERRLARKGCRVRTEIQAPHGRSVGTVLADIAQANGADLIVVGGYSHSRLREQFLGGATSELVSRAHAHVLFAH